jgi:hypothetical protein
VSSVSSVLVLNVGLLTTAGWGIEPSGRDDVDALRLLRLRQAKMPPVITMTTTPKMTKYIAKPKLSLLVSSAEARPGSSSGSSVASARVRSGGAVCCAVGPVVGDHVMPGSVGWRVVGDWVGEFVGSPVVGDTEGAVDGDSVGALVGVELDGDRDGGWVGRAVGEDELGTMVGAAVVGAEVVGGQVGARQWKSRLM